MGGVGLDDVPLPAEGHHAVGHVKEEGVQLVPLVLHLLKGALQLVGHIVEGGGEDADLIPGVHLDLLGEVSGGHLLRSLGKPLDGGDEGLGQKEGKENRNQDAKAQGL